MIQRIQSIWLLLAVLTLVCMLFLPLLTKHIDNTVYHLYIDGLRQQMKDANGNGYSITSLGGIALTILSALMSLISIFQFKNRDRQKRLASFAILLIILVIVLCGLNTSLLPGGINGVSVNIGAFLPLLAIIFNVLALRGIRHDEQLLKSADRLR